MEIRYEGKNDDRTKFFTVSGPKGSVTLTLYHVEPSDEVQVRDVNWGEGPKGKWSEHGKLKDLLLKFTGVTFTGTRKDFIRSRLFFSRTEA